MRVEVGERIVPATRRRSAALRAPGLPGSNIVACVLLVLAMSAAPSGAALVPPWVTDGTVHATALAGGTLYIGGEFGYVGPATGSLVALDPATAQYEPSLPRIEGDVFAIAADGAGGWYVGGAFSSVGGMARANLAHIAGDLSLTAWNPGTNGAVRALAVSGPTVYVGGDFTTAGDSARSRIAALDAVSGEPTAWNPGANERVSALLVSGSTVFVGGRFATIGGQPRIALAALDAGTGAATGWHPVLSCPANDFLCSFGGPRVDAFALDGSMLYVGGKFQYGSGASLRNYAMAFDLTSGAATAWDPEPGAGLNGSEIFALAVSGANVVLGGNFTRIGSAYRYHLAMVDGTTGLATSWRCDVGEVAYPEVDAVAVSGSTVFAGGKFNQVGISGTTTIFPRRNVVAVDTSTGAFLPWNPALVTSMYAIAGVYALDASGARVLAGGDFFSTGGLFRENLAALDIATGAATAWNPGADSWVNALVVDGGTAYAGGHFTQAGGSARQRLAALETDTGIATAWNPGADSDVHGIAVVGSTLVVGGAFLNVGGQPRACLATLDRTTGLATDWNPAANGIVDAVLAAGPVLYAGGEFTSMGDSTRMHLAAFDAAGGALTGWNPGLNFTAYALAAREAAVYVGGAFSLAGGASRSNLAAFDASTGAVLPWAPQPNYAVRALAVDGGTVYAGGDFGVIDGQVRGRAAQLDATTGHATDWDFGAAGGGVLAFAMNPACFYAGGSFTLVGGAKRPSLAGGASDLLAVEPPPADPRVSAARTWPNPFQRGVRVAFRLERPTPVRLEVLDIAGRRVADSPVRLVGPGEQHLDWVGTRADGSPAAAGLYLLRVSGPGFVVTGRAVKLD